MDVSERQAQLNTQVRFHNYRAALPMAYALRLELELMSNRNEKQEAQLERVQLRIRQLERLTQPFYVRVTRALWHRLVEPDPEPPLPPIHDDTEPPSPSAPEENQ